MREIEPESVFALVAAYSEQHAPEVARMIEAVPADEALRILRGLPEDAAAAVFRELSVEAASRVLSRMDGALTQAVLRESDTGHLAALMSLLDQHARQRVWEQLSPAETEQLKTVLESEPDTAGTLLDSSVLTVSTDTTADEALARLRKATNGNHSDFLYVVSRDRVFEGVIPLSRLARAAGSQRMAEICSPRETVAGPATSRGELLSLLDGLGVSEIPVVEGNGRFLGVVRSKDLRDREEEQARHSMRHTLDRRLEERADTGVLKAIRLRAPWLGAHLLAAAAASLIIGMFPGSLSSEFAFAALLPVVLLVTLRAGTQALNVSVRGLSLGAIATDDWVQRLTKELSVGLGLGILIAAVAGSAAYLWEPSRLRALPLAFSLIVSIPLSAAVGGVAPLAVLGFGKQPLKPASVAVAAFSAVAGSGSFLLAARFFSGITW